MTDLALQQLDDGTYDIAVFAGDFVADDSLRSAVLVSLFSDAEDPEITDGQRRGWWGDSLSAVPNDRIGSQLWKLDRTTVSQDTVQQAQSYMQQALACLVSDGVASAVTVTASLDGPNNIAASIQIDRPTGTESYRVASIWMANLSSPFDAPNATANNYADTGSLLNTIWQQQLPEGDLQ